MSAMRAMNTMRGMNATRALVVWREGRRVGRLDHVRSGELRFTYDADITDADPGVVIGVRCPVRAAPYVGPDAVAVFANLLPEGDLLSALSRATRLDPSDTVGLLGAVGGECAGALQLWPDDGTPPPTPAYDPVTAGQLASLFEQAGGQRRQVEGRASLSGTQPKLALWRRPPVDAVARAASIPEYRLPRHGAPTTVVVKQPSPLFPGVLEAELVGMRLMEAAGVPVASSARCQLAPDCHESARFDRTMAADGSVARRHAEDGCQLTGRAPGEKYAGPGGVTYQALVAVLRRQGARPAEDRERLLRWALVNACIGNHDAHAKNVSVVHDPDGRIRLAPAYDVVVTTIFPGLDRSFALAFGGTTEPRAFTPHRLAVAAREFGVTTAFARACAEDVLARVRTSLEEVLHVVHGLRGDPAVLSALRAAVMETSADFAHRAGLP